MRHPALSPVPPSRRLIASPHLAFVLAAALVPIAGCNTSGMAHHDRFYSRSSQGDHSSSSASSEASVTTRTVTLVADAAANEMRTVDGVGGAGRSDAEIEQDVSAALPHHTREVWTTSERKVTERVSVPRRVRLIGAVGGANAICAGGVRTLAQLQEVFVQRRAEYEAVLAEAGDAGKAAGLFAAVAKGDVTETQLPVGTDFAWMALRSGGRAHAASDLRWAGAAPLRAFEVRVGSGKETATFAIPAACCNLALVAPATATP